MYIIHCIMINDRDNGRTSKIFKIFSVIRNTLGIYMYNYMILLKNYGRVPNSTTNNRKYTWNFHEMFMSAFSVNDKNFQNISKLLKLFIEI